GYYAEHGTMGDLQRICAEAAQIDTKSAAQLQFFIERSFRPFSVRDAQQPVGKFTGYYEPLLRGSWRPDARYRHPVYARPRDIVVVELGDFDPDRDGEQLAGRMVGDHLRPYFDRKEILDGALRGRQLELLWVDSAIDLFFLHVQGSGRILLPDGSFVRLAFSGRNGHRYTSIGRELVAQGVMKVEDVTMPSLRAWMEANPLAAEQLMVKNKSYIFFRVEKDPVVKGAMGIALTPGRSLAVDPKFVPLGLPVWLVTTDPLDPKNQTPLRRMMVAQDTGSAIKGVVRGDVFWGFGPEAESRAGLMNEAGIYYLLLPRKPLS
ncbi:MAG TPA: murein transglycosylase, partial [Rhodospirillaceae bacterium]|nr:murein transglycosylase [Rhodospirillaceae bacterium]